MKKMIRLMLTVVLAGTIGIIPASAAFAEESGTAEAAAWSAEEEWAQTLEKIGVEAAWPEAFRTMNGAVRAFMMGDLGMGAGVYLVRFDYYAMPSEEYLSIRAKNPADLTDQEKKALDEAEITTAFLFAARGSRSFEEVWEIVAGNSTPAGVTDLGTAEDVRFYYLPSFSRDVRDALGSEYRDEYEQLGPELEAVLENASYSIPENSGSGLVGQTLQFSTTDLDGNLVNSETLFSGHRITMINVWATWCGPCVAEMPQLQRISEEYQDKDCQVVGLLQDGEVPGAPEKARSIMEENGTDYPVLMPLWRMQDLLQLQAFPTTFFVDSTGTILTEPVIGAYTDLYRVTLDMLTGQSAASQGNSENS